MLCEFSNWYVEFGCCYMEQFKSLFSGFSPVTGKAAAALNLGVL